MSAQIKRFIVPDAYRTHPVKIIADGFTAAVVLHTDHLAAMAAASAYDEAAERKAAFEACPADFDWGMFWQGWKTCAKARAKAAGRERC